MSPSALFSLGAGPATLEFLLAPAWADLADGVESLDVLARVGAPGPPAHDPFHRPRRPLARA